MTLSVAGEAVSVAMTATDNVGSPTIRYTINGGVPQA